MKKLMAALNLIDRINMLIGKGMSYLIFPLIAIVAAGVISRYVFKSPIIGAMETSQFIFGGIGVLVGGYCILMRRHVRMDMLYNRLSPRKRAVLDVITAPVFFYFIAVLLWHSGRFALDSIAIMERHRSVWSPYVFPIKAVLPVAVFLVLLQGGASFIRNLVFAIRGRMPS